MLRALLFLAGCGLVVAGVAMWSTRLALVVGGLLVCGLAVLLERSAARRETTRVRA